MIINTWGTVQSVRRPKGRIIISLINFDHACWQTQRSSFTPSYELESTEQTKTKTRPPFPPMKRTSLTEFPIIITEHFWEWTPTCNLSFGSDSTNVVLHVCLSNDDQRSDDHYRCPRWFRGWCCDSTADSGSCGCGDCRFQVTHLYTWEIYFSMGCKYSIPTTTTVAAIATTVRLK